MRVKPTGNCSPRPGAGGDRESQPRRVSGGLSIRVDRVAGVRTGQAAAVLAVSTLNLDERVCTIARWHWVSYILELEQILTAYRGGDCPLRITYQEKGASAVLAFGDDWRVQPTDELIRRLERLLTWSGRGKIQQ